MPRPSYYFDYDQDEFILYAEISGKKYRFHNVSPYHNSKFRSLLRKNFGRAMQYLKDFKKSSPNPPNYAQELAASGLLTIRTNAQYKKAWERWGMPVRLLREGAPLKDLFGAGTVNAADVFCDDDQEGKVMAVIISRLKK